MWLTRRTRRLWRSRVEWMMCIEKRCRNSRPTCIGCVESTDAALAAADGLWSCRCAVSLFCVLELSFLAVSLQF